MNFTKGDIGDLTGNVYAYGKYTGDLTTHFPEEVPGMSFTMEAGSIVARVGTTDKSVLVSYLGEPVQAIGPSTFTITDTGTQIPFYSLVMFFDYPEEPNELFGNFDGFDIISMASSDKEEQLFRRTELAMPGYYRRFAMQEYVRNLMDAPHFKRNIFEAFDEEMLGYARAYAMNTERYEDLSVISSLIQ